MSVKKYGQRRMQNKQELRKTIEEEMDWMEVSWEDLFFCTLHAREVSFLNGDIPLHGFQARMRQRTDLTDNPWALPDGCMTWDDRFVAQY